MGIHLNVQLWRLIISFTCSKVSTVLVCVKIVKGSNLMLNWKMLLYGFEFAACCRIPIEQNVVQQFVFSLVAKISFLS